MLFVTDTGGEDGERMRTLATKDRWTGEHGDTITDTEEGPLQKAGVEGQVRLDAVSTVIHALVSIAVWPY